MEVLILNRAPGKLRGEVTRWMLEVDEGVYVARLSSTVRERLWEMVCAAARPRTLALMVYSCDSDQGYAVKLRGKPGRALVDFDGLTLVRTPE